MNHIMYKLVVVGDAEVVMNTLVNGELWNEGNLLELLKIVEKSPNGHFIEAMNATLGGKIGVIDSSCLDIRHQGRYKMLVSRFEGDAILLDSTKIKGTTPGREKVRWMDGDKLDLIEVGKMAGKKHFEMKVINKSLGEIGRISTKYLDIKNKNKMKSLVLKFFK